MSSSLRRIGLKTESVELALKVIESGFYLGYLPMKLAGKTEVLALEVLGCPYHCKTDSFLLAKNPTDFGWMARLFAKAAGFGPSTRGGPTNP